MRPDTHASKAKPHLDFICAIDRAIGTPGRDQFFFTSDQFGAEA
jgi:hypothetical protein